jgi:CBS domain-containing protein
MKVRDIMQTDVVTIGPDRSVRDLVQLLARHRISGVPVVDPTGKVIGVVSATDVLALAAYGDDASRSAGVWNNDEGAMDEETEAFYRINDAPIEFVMRNAQNLPEYQVKDIMTTAVYSVPPHVTVGELARFMLGGRIHRALVLDEGELIGIVSTFDVLQVVDAFESAAEVVMG